MLTTAALIICAVSGSLAIEARASHTEVLVGETVRVDVTWRAAADVTVIADDPTTGVGAFRVMVDDGSGPSTYLEAGSNIVEITTAPIALRRGEEIERSFWFRRRVLHAGEERELFDRPGIVTMRIVYDDPARGVQAATNLIRFTVSAPVGDDARLLDELRRRPRFDFGAPQLADLVLRYPTSRYTPHLKLKLHGEREILLMRRVDPDTMQSIGSMPRAGFEALARRVKAEAAQDLLEGSDWPVLDADRLALAVRAAEYAGDGARAARARAALFQRFAATGPAKEIRREDTRDAAQER